MGRIIRNRDIRQGIYVICSLTSAFLAVKGAIDSNTKAYIDAVIAAVFSMAAINVPSTEQQQNNIDKT